VTRDRIINQMWRLDSQGAKWLAAGTATEPILLVMADICASFELQLRNSSSLKSSMQTTQFVLLWKVYLGRVRFHPASTVQAGYRSSATIRSYTESKAHSEDKVKSNQQTDSSRYNNTNAQDQSPKS
jgi:hypothetical protein